MKPARLLALLLGLIALVVIALLPVSVPGGDDIRIANAERPSDKLVRDVTVAQEFPVSGGAIVSLGVLMGTYQRVNQGALTLTLEGERQGVWQPLANATIATERVRDNSFTTIPFTPPLTVADGERLRLTLQSVDGPENAIAWWISESEQRAGYTLRVNGTPQVGAACFMVTYMHPTGRLVQMVGPIWERMTLFLNPAWRLLLLVGLTVLAATFLVVSGILLSGVRRAAPPRRDLALPADTGDDREGAGNGDVRHHPGHAAVGPRE